MIEGTVYHKFSRTFRRPYEQECVTCGERFLATVANKRYCSYYCMPNKSKPMPKEDGMIELKLRYCCSECGAFTVEMLMVSNKSQGLEYLLCRACAGGSNARV